MKKIIFCFTLLLTHVYAQPKFDTVSTRNVGVGIIHIEILEPAKPWTIDVLEIDLSNPMNKIESVKAKNNLLGNETTSDMASARDSAGHVVVGAINGDFYASGGIPIGKQIVNGEIVKQNSLYSSFAINTENRPAIDRPSFSGSIVIKNNVISIDNINGPRIQDNLILYNSFFGPSTETNEFGTEVVIKPVNSWLANDTLLVTVEKVETGAGNAQIKKGEAVLSGHGISAQSLQDNIGLGDTLKLYLGFSTSIKSITQMIGGYPRIIKNGSNYVDQGYNEEGGPPHTYERHPRTAMGFSQDSTKLYFVTVDGRGYSVGMTLDELADFMIGIGAHEGINLDGGGSTTMFIRNRITNVPSDGSERPVGNSILVYTEYPETDTLNSISINPDNLRIFKGEKVSLRVEGWDRYFNPAGIARNDVKYTIESEIGEIDTTGVFIAGNESGSGLIIAEYLGFKDTCKVFVKSIGKIQIKPKEVLINSVTPFEFEQSVWDVDGVPKSFENNEFTWSVSDTNIASINQHGILTGKNDGSAEVYLGYDDLIDTAIVTVLNKSGITLLHSFDNTDNLTLSGENLNLGNSHLEIIDEPKTEGSSSLKIVYEYTGNSSKIYTVGLDTDIPIAGVPDSIKVDLMTNGYRNQMIFFFNDDNEERFQLNVKKWADVSEYLDVQPGAFSNIATTGIGDIFNFPVTLKELMIKLSGPKEDGVIYRDSLIIDNLRISYPDITTDVEETSPLPTGFNLYQNYPNPFNPSTTIKYSLAVDLRNEYQDVRLNVFDILGREITTLVNEKQKPGNYEVIFDASQFASGVYFYKLFAGGSPQTKTMILLK